VTSLLLAEYIYALCYCSYFPAGFTGYIQANKSPFWLLQYVAQVVLWQTTGTV